MRNFKPLAILCGHAARFVWDLVGNPEDRFSHNEAQIYIDCFKNENMETVCEFSFIL